MKNEITISVIIIGYECHPGAVIRVDRYAACSYAMRRQSFQHATAEAIIANSAK
jgi:hypothetical protein